MDEQNLETKNIQINSGEYTQPPVILQERTLPKILKVFYFALALIILVALFWFAYRLLSHNNTIQNETGNKKQIELNFKAWPAGLLGNLLPADGTYQILENSQDTENGVFVGSTQKYRDNFSAQENYEHYFNGIRDASDIYLMQDPKNKNPFDGKNGRIYAMFVMPKQKIYLQIDVTAENNNLATGSIVTLLFSSNPAIKK